MDFPNLQTAFARLSHLGIGSVPNAAIDQLLDLAGGDVCPAFGDVDRLADWEIVADSWPMDPRDSPVRLRPILQGVVQNIESVHADWDGFCQRAKLGSQAEKEERACSQ